MSVKLLSRALISLVTAVAFSQISFADPISGCANNPGSPTLSGGVLITSFSCNLYNTGGSYSINLTPYETQGGASLAANAVSAGYLVVIEGNPLTISSASLFNEALWDAVLYFPPDLANLTSDTLTVFWPGSFPTASTVQSFDNLVTASFGVPTTAFFAQGTHPVTSIDAGTYNVFLDPVATPEPASVTLLGSGVLALGLVAIARKMKHGQAPGQSSIGC